MDFGGFGMGFAQGFGNGVQMGNTFNNAMKQYKIDKVREQGMEEAKAARDSSISGMIKDNGIGMGQSQDAPQASAQPGTQTGQTAPDTPEVQTFAVPTPPAVQSAPLAPPVMSPQDAADAAPARPQGLPVAPTVAPAAPPPAPGIVPPAAAAPVASTAPTPDTTGATSPAAVGTIPPAAAAAQARKRFSVGDASFDTIEEARSHAEKSAPSVQDFFIKKAVPKISEAYLAQGDVEKADAWEKYAKERTTQKNMETWSKAWRAAQTGDLDTAANHVFELYKSFDDGVTPISKETVKDKDGNVTGFNVKLKVDGTGETRSQFIDRDTLLNMGMGALSPQGMFEQAYKQKQVADAARLSNAQKAADEQRKLQGQVTLQGQKDAASMEREKLKGQQRMEQISVEQGIKDASIGKAEKAKVTAKVEALRGAGYDEDTIKGMMPALVGAGEHKKTTDPTERRALIFSDLSKNDPKFARATPEEQNAKVEAAMKVIYSGGGSDAAPAAAPGKPTAPTPTAPQARGVPVYDTKTGKTILLDPVTRKPIQ